MQIDDSALEVHDQDQPYTLDLVVWVSMRFPLEGDDGGYVRGCTVIQTEIGTLRRCPKHAIRAFRSRILFRSVPWYKRVFVARLGSFISCRPPPLESISKDLTLDFFSTCYLPLLS